MGVFEEDGPLRLLVLELALVWEILDLRLGNILVDPRLLWASGRIRVRPWLQFVASCRDVVASWTCRCEERGPLERFTRKVRVSAVVF